MSHAPWTLGEAAALIARWAHLLGLMLLFGSLLFMIAVAPRVRDGGGTARLARAGAWLSLAAGLAWLVLAAAGIVEATTVAGALAAIPPVVTETRFGTLLAARLALVLICALLPLGTRTGTATAALLAALALASQALIGHAGAVGDASGTLLMASEAVHLLAAGAWLGALPALLLSLRAQPAGQGLALAAAFFPLGLGAVTLIAATACVQAAMLIGSLPALIGTTYGRLATCKLLGLVALAALAARNQWSLVPAAAGGPLARAVRVELALGCMVVLAAAWLASSPPAVDETPGWPITEAPHDTQH
jgi:putative copper export protein